jgi:hypothetical protein
LVWLLYLYVLTTVVIAAVSVAKHRKKRLVFVPRLSVATAVVILAVITVAAVVVGVDVGAVVIMTNIHLTIHHLVMVHHPAMALATALLRAALATALLQVVPVMVHRLGVAMVHHPVMVRRQEVGEVGKA